MADFYFSVILENILNVFKTATILQHLLVSPSLLLFPGRDVFFHMQLHIRNKNVFHLTQRSSISYNSVLFILECVI